MICGANQGANGWILYFKIVSLSKCMPSCINRGLTHVIRIDMMCEIYVR